MPDGREAGQCSTEASQCSTPVLNHDILHRFKVNTGERSHFVCRQLKRVIVFFHGSRQLTQLEILSTGQNYFET